MSLPPHSPDDELVSAVLDGAATADQRARVEADPELQAHLDRFRTIRDAVAAPVAPLDDLQVRRLLDHALDQGPSSTGTGVTHAAVPHARPGARRRRRQLPPAILGVAAAVLLLLAAVPVLRVLGDGGEDDGDQVAVADAGHEEAAPSAESSDGAGGADASEGDATPEQLGAMPTPGETLSDDAGQAYGLATGPMLDLGSFASVGDLLDTAVAAARSEDVGAPLPPGIERTANASPCDPARDDAELVVTAHASVGGSVVVTHVWLDRDTLVLRVLDPVACTVVAAREAPLDAGAGAATDAIP